MDQIYSAEQIEVPQQLPSILKAYTKEVIRYNPPDIPTFSKEYVSIYTYINNTYNSISHYIY